MELAFFLYNTVLIGVAIVTCAVSIVVWLMTSRRDCIVAVTGFVCYAVELALIFFDEYSNEKYDYAITFDQPLLHPLVTTLLGVAVVACIWTWVLMRTHADVTPRSVLAMTLPFGVLCFILVPREGMASTVQQYLYWLCRDLGIVVCLAYAAWRYWKKATDLERLDLDRSRTFFSIACVLTACMIVEDTILILLWRPSSGSALESTFFWYFSERNFSENILMVVCAVQLLHRYRDVLVVYSHHPRTDDLTGGERPAMAQDDLQSRVMLFGDAHGLSSREQEVLGLVLQGSDTQNIASELFISVGTVKTHLHRIYQKVGVSNKGELVEAFWKE